MSSANPVGAFPQTPVASRKMATTNGGHRPANNHDNAATTTPPSNPLPVAPQQGARSTASGSAPVIPLHIVDAPTQRFYAFGLYVALLAWKFYDWAGLVEENAESFWLFLKWIAIDCVFLFGLPELRIPWLELSQPFVVVAFFAHAVFDWMLMFNVGLPWQAWVLGLVRVFYDREVAISEHNVKVSSILRNESLIMGRQVINILPEGTAVLNPEVLPFCLGPDRKVAAIPIYFNATTPVDVEIIRTDLDTNQPESIKLTRSQLRDIERKVKGHTQDGEQTVVQFEYPAKKPGVYRLGQVLDEYKLRVDRKSPVTFVVPCPRAWVGPTTSSARCVGDLSDATIQVEGTAPMKIVYGLEINGKDRRFHFQSLQPDGFSSPLTGSGTSRSILATGADLDDISWTRPQRVPVSLNESMHQSGQWQYSVDEVVDAFGNTVKYASPADDPEGKPKPKHLVQNFVVKERPQVRLSGCNSKTPLKVAKGKSKELPVVFGIPGPTPDDTSHTLTWQFSPIDTLTESGDHGDVVSVGSYNAKNARDRPQISAPGLYTLKSVASGSCDGEVQEPASCLLLNPLEPKLTIRSEEIPDTCAGNSVGLRVDLDLIGTPPFTVRYDVVYNDGHREKKKEPVEGLRRQLELVPTVAGHHKYIFTSIDDAIYHDQRLSGPEYVLEQDVKPAAAAYIEHSSVSSSICLGDEAAVPVQLYHDAPFTLEWEIIHDGKRKQQRATNIQESRYFIKTGALTQGGEYTIALTSAQDKRGCKIFLQEEVKISVRRQSPRAGFGQIGSAYRMMAVEGSPVKLPVRLTGEGPWTVQYTNLGDGSLKNTKVVEKKTSNGNDFLEARDRGLYSIVSVRDNQCGGVVDPRASTFHVDWHPQPKLSVALSHGIEKVDDKYVVDAVCEGDVSGFEVGFRGAPPYHVKYEVRHQPIKGSGSSSIGKKELDAASGKASISSDTAKAGTYTYKFTSLSDNLYDNAQSFKPLIVQQKVNRKPSASFVKPGQTFKFCKADQAEGDGIPITLSGIPPFSLEVEIKHHSSAAPEIYRTPLINSNSYEIKIPKHLLRLGTQHVRIRDVKDGGGCHSITGFGSASVQVQLYEAPTIYPLDSRTDYCVGERIAYTLSGTPPFEVWYTFDGTERKAKSPTTNFRRIAESPGVFSITTVSDKASECRAPVNIVKTIHPMPAVRISKGRNVQIDIHEGSEVEIQFEFWGTPPFEFTYTRSTNAKKGAKSHVLETRHDVSHEHTKTVWASQEGTYEVVAIKDKYCAFSTQAAETKEKGQKLLTY
ncbi:hypothetical protein B0T16DRAFT_371410 [Cercophora newfieldiana]|uniref:Nucleoporin Pom152 n=1 Tax=Cercophora newfieldiana TaxID=92897 RepID=A0AA39YD41_9PEZI|nr:hypothetical protein B0T16DRAFT_371410 [Cercophora newfieldiana]